MNSPPSSPNCWLTKLPHPWRKPDFARLANYVFETSVIRAKLAPVKSKILLPAIFILVFALSRIPGLMPLNFSVAYAFAFCSGVFIQGRRGWWLPLATLFITDIGLNFYYQYKLHIEAV